MPLPALRAAWALGKVAEGPPTHFCPQLNTEYRNEFIDKEVPFVKAGPRIDQPVQTGPFDPTRWVHSRKTHFFPTSLGFLPGFLLGLNDPPLPFPPLAL
jgi:hypothetical protein